MSSGDVGAGSSSKGFFPSVVQPAMLSEAAARQPVMNLINCILGAAMLGYPYCFRSCGLLLATSLMAASYLACRFSYQLLLYCSQLTGLASYEAVAEYALGRSGRVTVELCTAALNLGALVAYINILADVLSAVAGTLVPPGADPSRGTYIAGG
jgi:sodium-coupled neutral amino acid transporter 10